MPGMRGTPHAVSEAKIRKPAKAARTMIPIMIVDESDAKSEGQRPEGDAAPAQDPGALRIEQGPAPLGRGCLQGAHRRRDPCRSRYRLSRAHAVRARRPALTPAFRDRQGGVRAERGPAS